MLEELVVISTIIAVFILMSIPGVIVWLAVRNTKWFQKMFPPIEFDGEEW